MHTLDSELVDAVLATEMSAPEALHEEFDVSDEDEAFAEPDASPEELDFNTPTEPSFHGEPGDYGADS